MSAVISEEKQNKIKKRVQREYQNGAAALTARDDYRPGYRYFLELLAIHAEPEQFRLRFNRPLAAVNCVQVPAILFHAAGVTPYRFCGNALSRQELAASRLPALSCPLFKSCLSSFLMDDSIEAGADMTVIAGTCDWMTRLPELIEGRVKQLQVMELPHMKDSERGCRRWLEEITELKTALETLTGRRITRRDLLRSMVVYARAAALLRSLLELREQGRIAAVWCLVVTNALMMGDLDGWCDALEALLSINLPDASPGRRIFLAGSPVTYPNLKVFNLIEEAGLQIAADELCTSERVLSTVAVSDDHSEAAMLQALAEGGHLGCSCPTYSDNKRRLSNIMDTMRRRNISGLVLHILKGCHPYDIGSFRMEQTLRENGFHFLRIETDHSPEDSKSLLLRLEAFAEIV